RPDREQPHDDQRQQYARNAYAGSKHGDYFVRAGHSSQAKQQRQQQRHRQQDNENLRHLSQIIMNHSGETEVLVDERRDVVADIKDQPDRDEPDYAVNVDLQKIFQDVTIE